MSSQDHLSSHLARLTLSPPSHGQGPSPFLKLPNEIIHIIFDLLRDAERRDRHKRSPECGYKPLCRRLWPMQQRALYRRIEIIHVIGIALLARTVIDQPHLGDLVKHLSLGPDYNSEWAMEYSPRYFGDVTRPVHAARHLSRLLGGLGHLEELCVRLSVDGDEFDINTYEWAILHVLVQDASTPVKLGALRSLYFHVCGIYPVTEINVDNAALFMVQFSRFPALETIDLSITGGFPDGFFVDNLSAPLVLENLSELSMFANFEHWDLSLDAVAPNLDRLVILTDDVASRSVISRAPTRLRELAVGGSQCEAMDDLLPALTLLQSLNIGPSGYDPIRTPSSLHQLDDLEDLAIECGPDLNDELLRGLVKGRHQLAHLRLLLVDLFSYENPVYGPTLRAKSLVLPADAERDESGLWLGWRAPDWPAGLTEAGLAEVVEMALARGVRVYGSAVRALKWRKVFEGERDLVAVCRGLSMDDWTDARRFLGDERVDAFLSRRRREGRRRSLGRELSLL
ncbi:hypothetical protein JCM8208_005803 [Rhodotorula glutinis]